MADEKIYTVPLGKAFDHVRTKRVKRAVALVQAFIARHSKVELDSAKVSNALNAHLWARGIQKPPRKVKIKIVKEGEVARAYLVDEKIVKPEKKEAKAEGKPEEKAEAKEGKEVPKQGQEKKDAKATVPKASEMHAPREMKENTTV